MLIKLSAIEILPSRKSIKKKTNLQDLYYSIWYMAMQKLVTITDEIVDLS